MQTKEIKLNISYISYIVLGLLAFILLFAAFTSTAHAQATIDIQNDRDKIILGKEGTLVIGSRVSGAEAHYCMVYDSVLKAETFAERSVTKEARAESLTIIKAEDGRCIIPRDAAFLESTGTLGWLAFAVVNGETTNLSKGGILEVREQGFLGRFWSGLLNIFKKGPAVPDKKVISGDCCQIIQDEIIELEGITSPSQDVIDDIAALETTLGILCPPPLPPITFPPIRVPVIGDIGFPGTGTGTGITVNLDGTTTTITTDAGGTITTIDYPNGTSVTIGSDGTITWTFGDGTVKIEDANGDFIITYSNGNILSGTSISGVISNVSTSTVELGIGVSTPAVLVAGQVSGCSIPPSIKADLQLLATSYNDLDDRDPDTEYHISLLAQAVSNFLCGCDTAANDLVDTINDGVASQGDINTALNALLGCL